MTTVTRSPHGRVLHDLRTHRAAYGAPWTASCSCGWVRQAAKRATARALVRRHQARSIGMPTFQIAMHTDPELRPVHTAFTAAHVDDLAWTSAWALADGIGDTEHARDAAELAVQTPVRVAGGRGAHAALLAASQQVNSSRVGDAVMVVAVPIPAHLGGGYDIAWVGEAHAYQVRGSELMPLTVDRTEGRPMSQAQRDSIPKLGRWTASPPHAQRVVPTTVATATWATIRTARTAGMQHRLLLTSHGVHDAVPATQLAERAIAIGDPRTCAHRIVLDARQHHSPDNSTILVADPIPV